jgi:hypothetical protein
MTCSLAEYGQFAHPRLSNPWRRSLLHWIHVGLDDGVYSMATKNSVASGGFKARILSSANSI